MEIADTHEHLPPESERVPSAADFSTLASHYVMNDAVRCATWPACSRTGACRCKSIRGSMLALVRSFPNAFIDFCRVYVLSGRVAAESLHKALDLLPVNRILGFMGGYRYRERR